MTKNYDIVIDNYLKEKKFDNICLEDFENNHDLCIFLYLHYKSLIVNLEFEELDDYFKMDDLYYYNLKILKELIYDQNYFKIFNDELKRACYSFVSLNRGILEEKNNKNSDEWEELNSLIRLIYEKDNEEDKEDIEDKEYYYGMRLVFNELVDRNIDVRDLRYIDYFLDNYEKIVNNDDITFILYKFFKDDLILQDKRVLTSALLHLNKIIELDLTYDSTKLYCRSNDKTIRNFLEEKKLSRKNF